MTDGADGRGARDPHHTEGDERVPPLPGPPVTGTGDDVDRPVTIVGGPAAEDSPDWRPGVPSEQAGLARRPADPPAPAPARITSFFSSTHRIGRWQVPEVLTVSGGFSETVLDLREAVVTSGVVELRLNDIFSSCKVIVPRGVGVDVQGGSALFSSLSGDYEGVSDPGRWRLTIAHSGAFSSVEIISLDPGEKEPKWWHKLW
ncbi:LiaF domain-containing protein [uncultured Serinicoccus sp.]|uniref:LiaF domain-containing protein n=1 Tax=uncultured Serinicoccus sp. TaxID=735514 RepID=UPI0026031302|nr:LiaF domain-containing protein [uncultured Serinicoccus sp.]